MLSSMFVDCLAYCFDVSQGTLTTYMPYENVAWGQTCVILFASHISNADALHETTSLSLDPESMLNFCSSQRSSSYWCFRPFPNKNRGHKSSRKTSSSKIIQFPLHCKQSNLKYMVSDSWEVMILQLYSSIIGQTEQWALNTKFASFSMFQNWPRRSVLARTLTGRNQPVPTCPTPSPDPTPLHVKMLHSKISESPRSRLGT